jgi:hypothetical protein
MDRGLARWLRVVLRDQLYVTNSDGSGEPSYVTTLCDQL